MIGFVILHYIVEEETYKCVQSIYDSVSEEKVIIIIDNASPNGSGERIREHYKDDKNIFVHINKDNVGFAKGNNKGYQIAKNQYNADFIVILNNDVEIEDSYIIRKIYKEYNENCFWILGPDIYSTSYKTHQSPKTLTNYTIDEIKKKNEHYRKQLSRKQLLWVKSCFKKSFILRKFVYQYKRRKVDYKQKRFNVPLHGAFLVYSPIYIENYNYAFFDGTFLYFETEILDCICNKHNIRTEYCPDIQVLHHQNVATNREHTNIFEKTIFSYKCNYESTKAFLDNYKEWM